jgi:hypothetical protein
MVCRPVCDYSIGLIIADRLAKVLSHDPVIFDRNTGIISSLRMAAFWLHQCLATHSKCRQFSAANSKLPPWVIDVGPTDGSQRPYVFRSGDGYGPYAILSYNRGIRVTTLLTVDYLRGDKIVIKENALPQHHAGCDNGGSLSRNSLSLDRGSLLTAELG